MRYFNKLIFIQFLLTGFCLAHLVPSLADTPLGPPESYRVCDFSVTYCAYLDPGQDTTVYKLEGDFLSLQTEKLYTVPGWHRDARISTTGEYFIAGYPGLNLVPLDVQPDQVVITIWKNGTAHHEVTLGELLKNWGSLERGASHYHWGFIMQAYPKHLLVETVEGKVLVSLESGEVHFDF